jgi:hypothetical protein
VTERNFSHIQHDEQQPLAFVPTASMADFRSVDVWKRLHKDSCTEART